MTSLKTTTLLSSVLPLLLWLYVDPSKNVNDALSALRRPKAGFSPAPPESGEAPPLAVVSCGESRYGETLNLFKSLLMFSREDREEEEIRVFLFADVIGERIRDDVRALERLWNPDGKQRIHIRLMDPYEGSSDFGDLSIFAPCANLRLFLPEVLPKNIPRIVYLDTDILFLSNPRELFSKAFARMASRGAMMALVTENRNEELSYYSKYSLLPSAKNGLNSGVIFMDLDAMRRYDWTERVKVLISHLENFLVFSDQDVINFFYYMDPEIFIELESNYNFRPDICGTEFLKDKGVILHGSRGAFHHHFYPSFRTLSWFLSSLRSNPLLLLYAIKTNSIRKEFEFFRNIYGLIQRAKPQEFISSSLQNSLRRSNFCSDYTEMISKSLRLQLRSQT